MSAKTNNFKLGLFTLFGLGLLATGVLAFGAWSSFEKKSLFETYVPGDVSGLTIGSAVEFRGVRVGKVNHIGFSWNEYQDSQPGCVVVVFEMNDSAFVAPLGSRWHTQLQSAIDRGLRARIKAQGVTGTCIVSLEYLNPEDSPPIKEAWTPRNTYIPSAPGLFGDLLVSMQRALHRLDRLDFTALAQLAQTDMKSAGRVLDKVEKVDFENLATNVTSLLHDARQTTAKLDNFIDDSDSTVKKLQLEKLAKDADELIHQADALARQAGALVKQLNDTVTSIKPGLAAIDFNSLNQTLARARQTLRDIDEVMSELKEYPSGFIFGQPPAKPKEVQTTNE